MDPGVAAGVACSTLSLAFMLILFVLCFYVRRRLRKNARSREEERRLIVQQGIHPSVTNILEESENVELYRILDEYDVIRDKMDEQFPQVMSEKARD